MGVRTLQKLEDEMEQIVITKQAEYEQLEETIEAEIIIDGIPEERKVKPEDIVVYPHDITKVRVRKLRVIEGERIFQETTDDIRDS